MGFMVLKMPSLSSRFQHKKKVLKKHIGLRDIDQGEISVYFGPPGDHFGLCSQSGDVGGE